MIERRTSWLHRNALLEQQSRNTARERVDIACHYEHRRVSVHAEGKDTQIDERPRTVIFTSLACM